jgi:mannose-6-phosphate isomerase-like protein (cupin superfamily)
MARQGDVLSNPVTGERVEFRQTARDTGGEALTFDYSLAPGGFAVGKVDHVHPRQEERFEVREGSLGVRIDGDEWTATAGTRFAVPAGTAHTVWNAGESEVHAVVEIRPALQIETFFETLHGLACDGKTDRMGIPGPLQAAVLADEFAEEIRAAKVPGSLQRAVAAVLARVGRLVGYRAAYSEYSGRRTLEPRPRA